MDNTTSHQNPQEIYQSRPSRLITSTSFPASHSCCVMVDIRLMSSDLTSLTSEPSSPTEGQHRFDTRTGIYLKKKRVGEYERGSNSMPSSVHVTSAYDNAVKGKVKTECNTHAARLCLCWQQY